MYIIACLKRLRHTLPCMFCPSPLWWSPFYRYGSWGYSERLWDFPKNIRQKAAEASVEGGTFPPNSALFPLSHTKGQILCFPVLFSSTVKESKARRHLSYLSLPQPFSLKHVPQHPVRARWPDHGGPERQPGGHASAWALWPRVLESRSGQQALFSGSVNSPCDFQGALGFDWSRSSVSLSPEIPLIMQCHNGLGLADTWLCPMWHMPKEAWKWELGLWKTASPSGNMHTAPRLVLAGWLEARLRRGEIQAHWRPLPRASGHMELGVQSHLWVERRRHKGGAGDIQKSPELHC